MLDREMDSAHILDGPFHRHAPAEEIACVICHDPTGDQPGAACFVDVNPTSPSYSEVIGEFPLRQRSTCTRVTSSEENSLGETPRSHRNPGQAPTDPIVTCVRLAHDPTCPFGFVSHGPGMDGRASTVSVWSKDQGRRLSAQLTLQEVITLADEIHDPSTVPTSLQPSGAVPALISDIALSPDDCYLYVACWGTGDLKQFDVSDPLAPREVGSVRIGGIAARAPHPSQARRLSGGPGTITVSGDGRRIYLTNALSSAWETHFYPDGLQGWMVKVDAEPGGGIAFDPNFFVDFKELRPCQVKVPDPGTAGR